MTREEFHAIRETICESIQSSIDKARREGIREVEIFAGFSAGASVTLEKNDLNTLDSFEETVYGIRVIENGCEGFLTTNNREKLIEAIREARSLACAQTTPDDLLELPPPPEAPTPPMDSLDESLFGLTPEDILDYASQILKKKESEYPKVSLDSADVSYSYSLKAICTTKGIFRSEAWSSLGASFMGMGIDGDDIGSFDSESCIGRSYKKFQEDFEEKYLKFLKSCMGGLGARTIESFKGYLFLPPDSVLSFLLGGLIASCSYTAIRMKRSKMEGKIGEMVAHPDLTITTTPCDPDLASATSFDREGQNTQNLVLVENGILRNYFYNHYEARKAGLPRSNGYATGGSGSPPGCGAKAVQVASGKTPRKDLENPDGKAIWLNRFSGTSNSSSGDFSGVIKGGYLLEKGEKIPVKEIQIAGNMYELLKTGIAGISLERELLGKSSQVPAILLEGISVIGK